MCLDYYRLIIATSFVEIFLFKINDFSKLMSFLLIIHTKNFLSEKEKTKKRGIVPEFFFYGTPRFNQL
jgi:hypothetical protein